MPSTLVCIAVVWRSSLMYHHALIKKFFKNSFNAFYTERFMLSGRAVYKASSATETWKNTRSV